MADVGASVLARLKNKAAESGRSYQLCLQLFCQEEFLRRVEKWKAFTRKINVSGEDFKEILQTIKTFLSETFQHAVVKAQFTKRWSAHEQKWM